MPVGERKRGSVCTSVVVQQPVNLEGFMAYTFEQREMIGVKIARNISLDPS